MPKHRITMIWTEVARFWMEDSGSYASLSSMCTSIQLCHGLGARLFSCVTGYNWSWPVIHRGGAQGVQLWIGLASYTSGQSPGCPIAQQANWSWPVTHQAESRVSSCVMGRLVIHPGGVQAVRLCNGQIDPYIEVESRLSSCATGLIDYTSGLVQLHIRRLRGAWPSWLACT